MAFSSAGSQAGGDGGNGVTNPSPLNPMMTGNMGMGGMNMGGYDPRMSIMGMPMMGGMPMNMQQHKGSL